MKAEGGVTRQATGYGWMRQTEKAAELKRWKYRKCGIDVVRF